MEETGRVGVRDVARLAGVSPATVSRSLHGATSVSAPTRERVLRAASELGYTLPGAPAPPGSTTTVGVLARFPRQWFFAEAISGVEQVLSAAGFGTLLHNLGTTAGRAQFFATLPVRGRVDGLIVVASAFGDAEIAALDSLEVPITVVGGTLPGRTRVGVDDRAGARTAVRHLVGLGHTDVGLVSFDPDEACGRQTTELRRLGFDDALAEAGLSVRDGCVVSDGADVAAGTRAAERLLSASPLPTAVFAMSDELAFGLVRTLRRAGVDVPGRVSVVGFDDHELAGVSDLTTIAQPVRRQGELAARALLDTLAGSGAGDVELPTRLVVRGTTAPPSGRPGARG
ncbi:LacI family transcriptional regulator [Pseudonocardia sediminis]|uniref:LacI family transcriptional regulator n=1 Tax=Pseudonocardia sediminis TaxID=1397368 RepID=A0A4Q7UR39_PSEST|nr:LacI family DNA-binding transcriptional regulator [Pseudonocardia sediminis]RZT84287.1 LacI family transcriptional regulator [Pseudonocardia sediminis]